MTFEELDARYRTAVLSGDEEEWDDPESDEDDDELGYRDADEESSFDESAGDQGTDAAA